MEPDYVALTVVNAANLLAVLVQYNGIPSRRDDRRHAERLGKRHPDGHVVRRAHLAVASAAW